MLSEEEIITTLDYSNSSGYYSHFTSLGHPYSYLIDCRLNVFKGDNDRWAIAIERLGYNPRGARIDLEIDYFGNCLVNQEEDNGQLTNTHRFYPIDDDSYFDSIEEPCIKPDATHWLVRGLKVPLSTNKQDYLDKDIELKEYEPGEINIEEAGRLVIISHRVTFRATDEELYTSIPADLKKILVLDEWHHKDFNEIDEPAMTDEQLKLIWELNRKNYEIMGMTLETLTFMTRQQENSKTDYNIQQWEENRPGSYETWPMLAKVIATGDTSHYKPTLAPNTHWTNWPDSGSL
ncbi:DUF7003 family protein [Mucilaginibacter gotjawali]|uniref:Uncharacterized protein n=2 Tax=Mucilaginibacter gotjawali TaxID=1550579 RepID=A0A839SB26_9SPHI|nr:hypothetical protein [Mucilaginibacter gotjawali]MBB3055371.1 hypothetical protein [Mucilaginibacter gotjawali]BAU53352.1 hypothetical protein MgSA37_01519 [Mucilaginibacter gotjawali]